MAGPGPGVGEVDVEQRGPGAEARALVPAAIAVEPGIAGEDGLERVANLVVQRHHRLPLSAPRQPSGGRRSAQGAASSNAAAARKMSISRLIPATICSPTGSPSAVKPAGIEAAGWPVRLKG